MIHLPHHHRGYPNPAPETQLINAKAMTGLDPPRRSINRVMKRMNIPVPRPNHPGGPRLMVTEAVIVPTVDGLIIKISCRL